MENIDSRKFWIRLTSFAIGAILIFTFLPRQDKPNRSYEVDEPWKYETFLAPFDFTVYLDDATIQRKTDSIDANFVPVFRKDDTPLKNISAIIESADNVSPDEKRYGKAKISGLYRNGIVSNETAERIASGNLTKLKLTTGKSNGNKGRHKYDSISTHTMISQERAAAILDSIIDMRHPMLQRAVKQYNLAAMLVPNYVKDSAENAHLRTALIAQFKKPVDSVKTYELIINRGERVTLPLYQKLLAYDKEYAARNENNGDHAFNVSLGQLIFSIVVMATVYMFLLLYRKEVFESLPRVICLLCVLVGFFVFAVIMAHQFTAGLYIVPFAILPILFVVFYDTMLAMFMLVVEIALCASFASYQFEFVFIEIIAGLTAIYSMHELSRRSQLLRTSAYVLGAYVVSYAAVELMQVASLNSFSWRLFGYFGINVVLISFAYILIFIVEKTFGFISNVTLVELTDINNSLLRELSVECPGTFQHSMAVSNLATSAAHKIGANVQLVRAGALYHDIGKIKNPAFFTENQYGVNPHDALSPEQSARVIISHVTDGLKSAEKAKLPKVIRDMIVQHHGKSTARYFYTSYCNAHPDEDVDPTPFTYPGPNPQSKEASLLMMADVVEAASRSLPDYKPETISALVNRLIDAQVAEGLHKESPLSFRDITTIKQAFIDFLRTLYHTRIAYPADKRQKA